jgi:hypothetical protein
MHPARMRCSENALRVLISALVCACAGGVAPAADFGFEHGTAVVVLRSPRAIFAAVDSKETDSLYLDGKLTVDEHLMCKIRKVGPYYSIVAGVARATNGFDALQEVSTAYKPGDDLEQLGAAVRESVPLTLAPILKTILEVDPAMFARTYAGQPALQLTLVGSEQKSPKVLVVEFQAMETKSGDVALSTRTMSCPGDCPSPNTGYFLGAHEAIDQLLRQSASILDRPDEGGTERLIGLEYDSRPDIVGGPLSMLKISGSGSTVLRSGVCALN